MERLGLGYEALAARYPKLVYCSISGFGQTGPRSSEPGYDAVMQGEAGLMSITGAAGGQPFRLGVAISDIVTGMFAAQGITMALLARVRTGRGQRVDIGMFESTAALLTYQAGIYFATGKAPERMGNRHPTIVPYETFAASDGDFVIAVGNDEQWRRFCRVISAEALAGDPRFATNRGRVTHYEELRPLLVERLQSRTRGEWVAALKGAGVPCGSVRDIAEVLEDPHLDARDMIQTVEHISAGAVRVLGVPIKLSDTPGGVRTPPPALGQHTSQILQADCGLSPAEIDALRSGVIRRRDGANTHRGCSRKPDWRSPPDQSDDLVEQERHDVLFGEIGDRGPVADGALGADHAPPAAARGAADDGRGIGRVVERELDELFRRSLRRQPDRGRRREHLEGMAFPGQHDGELVERGHRALVEKRLVVAGSRVRARPADFGGLPRLRSRRAGGAGLLTLRSRSRPPLYVRYVNAVALEGRDERAAIRRNRARVGDLDDAVANERAQ